MLALERLHNLGELFKAWLLLDDVYVEAPVGRVEAPVANARLDVRVHRIALLVHAAAVRHEHLRRKQSSADNALHAPIALRIELVVEDAFGAAEAFVVHQK